MTSPIEFGITFGLTVASCAVTCTVLTTYTSGGAKCHMRGYHAFGGVRGVPGGDAYLATDHAFTGQKVDGSGLYYYNARYYDPVIGQFVSPDTIVPEPGRVDGYNRYMYVMGNPLRYSDPSGHDPWWVQDGPHQRSSTVGLPEYMTQAADTLTARQQQTVANHYFPPDPSLAQLAARTGARIAVEMLDYTTQLDSDGQIDWERTIGSTFGKALKVCAIAANGVCGVSFGGHADAFGGGARGSVDIFVDQTGAFDVLGTLGGGAYVPALTIASGGLAPGQAETSRLSIIAITNADVADMVGWSGQLGGGFAIESGVSTEWVFGRNSGGQYWHGVSLGASKGFFAELHVTATYSVSGSQTTNRIISSLR